MSVELTEDHLQIAERVCRAARHEGKPLFTVYHGDSSLPAAMSQEGRRRRSQLGKLDENLESHPER